MSKPHDNTRHVRDLSKFLLAIHGTSPGPYRIEFTLDRHGEVREFTLVRIKEAKNGEPVGSDKT